jgi:MFS family permease
LRKQSGWCQGTSRFAVNDSFQNFCYCLLMPQTNLHKNIWKYGLFLVADKRVFAAILSAYYLTIPGATTQTIGLILLCGSFAGFIFEIPSGYISDKIGHKQALVVSRILVLSSTTFFLFAQSTWMLIIGGICLAVGHSFRSGTDSAFMHETLRALGREDDYTTIMGKLSSIGFAVPIVFMILTPFLVAISFRAPFAFSLVLDLIGLIAALSFVSPHISPQHIKEIGVTNFKQVVQAGYNLGFFKYALFGAIVGGVLFGAASFRAPYQALLGVPIIYFGILFGLGRAIASLILAYSGVLKKYFSTLTSFYRFQLILNTLLFLALGLTENVWLVLGIFIISNGFQWGLGQIEQGFLLSIIKDSNFKATLLSTKAQIGLVFQGLTGFGLGSLFALYSYQTGFLLLSICFLITLTPLYFYIRRRSQ